MIPLLAWIMHRCALCNVGRLAICAFLMKRMNKTSPHMRVVRLDYSVDAAGNIQTIGKKDSVRMT